MKKLESTVFENVDETTGEIFYELWLHDYGNLSSQLIDIAVTRDHKNQLNKYCESMNNLLNQGGY